VATFGEGTGDLEFIGKLIREIERLADIPDGRDPIATINALIWDEIGSDGVRACVPRDSHNCVIAAYLKSRIGALAMARVSDLTVGKYAIDVWFKVPFDIDKPRAIPARFCYDTPAPLTQFITDYDKQGR
jgi:hypothetical protein